MITLNFSGNMEISGIVLTSVAVVCIGHIYIYMKAHESHNLWHLFVLSPLYFGNKLPSRAFYNFLHYPFPHPETDSLFMSWLPDGYSRIFRSYVFGPPGFWTMVPLRCAAKFDSFLSLDCAPTPSTLAQSKERKESNFAAQRSGAIVQKPEGPNMNNLKILL